MNVANAVISGVDILEKEVDEAQIVYTLYLSAGSIYFKGHFPSKPILPGVAQIDWAISLARPLLMIDEIKSLERIKFMRPIRPDSKITLNLNFSKKAHCLSYRYFDNSGDFSSGRIVLG